MAFWGTVVKENESYYHCKHRYNGRLRVTQATLGLQNQYQSPNRRIHVLCKKGNNSPITLCILIPEYAECQKLDIELIEKEEIVISVTGNLSVHLSGYFIHARSYNKDDDNIEPHGEDIADNESQKSSDSDDEYDTSDSFINDSDPGILTPSPKPGMMKTKGKFPMRLTPKFPLGKKKAKSSSKRSLIKKFKDDDPKQDHAIPRMSKSVIVPDSESEDHATPSSSVLKNTSAKHLMRRKKGSLKLTDS